MPREQINHPIMTASQESVDPEARRWSETALHVGWHPGSWVQVGLEVDVNYAKMAIASPNGSTSDRTQMWTDVLTADEIDRLVATLKRAKRKAFGRR